MEVMDVGGSEVTVFVYVVGLLVVETEMTLDSRVEELVLVIVLTDVMTVETVDLDLVTVG